jgi:hypothetical protein
MNNKKKNMLGKGDNEDEICNEKLKKVYDNPWRHMYE